MLYFVVILSVAVVVIYNKRKAMGAWMESKFK